MRFHGKYELPESFQGHDRHIAVPGTEISTGRPVVVHLLSGGYIGENEEILKAAANVPPRYRRLVLETGDHEGVPYIVTEVLPGNAPLRAWLASMAQTQSPPEPSGGELA